MAKIRRRKWKNKDGSESFCWFFDFTTKSGQRIRESGFKTKADAEMHMAKAISSPTGCTYSKEAKNLTLVEACTFYIELHAELHCKKSTCASYKGYLNNHIKPFFDNCKVKDVNKIQVEQFVKAKKDEGLSAQTINHTLTLLKAVFQKMIDDEIISNNPLSRVKKLRVIHKKFDVLDSTEVETLLNTAKEHCPDLYALIFTAIFTGMRQGELFALRWDRIDWANKKILIDSNYTKYHLTTPKSNKSRIVEMSEGLVQALQEWKASCPANNYNLVFPNKEGNYLDPNNLNKRAFKSLMKTAKIKSIRFHDLRHTYASLLIARNISVKYIQSQMGHSSIQMTMDIYGHILPEVTIRGVNALDSILKQNGTKLAQNDVISP
ncbi:MAG: site-specific integrase [Candidatus Gastranaerophilales bacterium]|nr:site-specific integrase [Candidatus Gastranaerophilales bacterium]